MQHDAWQRFGTDTVTFGPVSDVSSFCISIAGSRRDASHRAFRVSATNSDGTRGQTRTYELPAIGQSEYLHVFDQLAHDFGTRASGRRTFTASGFTAPIQPLLTHSISPDILYGYGDPAVLRVCGEPSSPEGEYFAVVTSNDAPLIFPILHSKDLSHWNVAGFAFSADNKPAWAASPERGGEYWAPELHRIRDRFVLCFSAREPDASLSIGLAWSAKPGGPFCAADEPLIRGGVIDPHLFVDDDGTTTVFWKEDTNGVWPSLLCQLIVDRPALIELLFLLPADARTAHFAAVLWPWIRSLRVMERFCVQQSFVDAVAADFNAFRTRLERLREATSEARLRAEIAAILDAMRTLIYGQQVDTTSGKLLGQPRRVLENDTEWEGHLVEGVWVIKKFSRYYMFYSGNDFSTARYGIGVAVAASPLGPYKKSEEPFVRSTADWWGPGHQSIADGPDGRPRLFFHAYHAGRAGYKEFRALLALSLTFVDGDDRPKIAALAAVPVTEAQMPRLLPDRRIARHR